MKNLLVFAFSAIALSLAADTFNTSFNECLSEGRLQAADSILRQWNSSAPDDPELFPARFNLSLNRARTEMLMLSDEAVPSGEQFELTDSTGAVAGYLRSEIVWEDSLVDRAFEEIDRGLAVCPDRVDFWLGKASAAVMTGRWSIATGTLDGLLERDRENRGRWLGVGNKVDAAADTLLKEALYDRMADICRTESPEVIESALPLVDKAARRFPDDNRILNLAGVMNIGTGHSEAAMNYFMEAMRVTPDDAMPLMNIAYICYEQGDTAKALEIYRNIEQGNFDEDSREYASRMIAEISAPVEVMGRYRYFFRYLPLMASQTEDVTEFMDVNRFNTVIPDYNRFRSPFADDDIKAGEVQAGDVKTVVWTFPMPERVPLCLYVVFVPGTSECHIMTLEKSFDDAWVIGSQNGEGH
ncbi:MAG: hypothetical protein K2J38_01920, partial [Muribaculaceae bacterium]|nr:hypothetical protein [Muribaculaceae bacterium]